ncbi:MAG: hypothetical protein GXN99_02165 [Candidatus Nanohaloarchaeota archaeon]|nr:hypothetical protein [Candidatus Nanohaloarchaeota archaeon]
MKRKGQSATEYLMTYGWALLAIAIVGGLLYMYMFSNKECVKTVKGFKDQGISIVDNHYQVLTNGSISFMLENRMDENATITKISIMNDRGEVVDSCTISPGKELYPQERLSVGLGGDVCPSLTAPPASKDACKRIGISITYNTETGLDNMIASGTIIAPYVAPA